MALRMFSSSLVRTMARTGVVQPVRAASSRTVNSTFQPGFPKEQCPVPSSECTRDSCICSGYGGVNMSKHAEEKWSKEEIRDAHYKHGLMTWGAHDAATQSAMQLDRTEGIYLIDADGKKYIDFNSQAMCVHHGHTPDASIVDAVKNQLETLAFAYPGAFVTPIRARLCQLCSEIFPGDINSFMFPSSGAEANEIAVRMARLYTGRHKVMSRYRSYHGATGVTCSLGGDQRRWPAEMGTHGHLKFFDPFPYRFSYGDNEQEIAENALTQLREQIEYEGPHLIAAIFVESITGTNGVLIPPKGYLEGVRKLCTEYGILMVCDEVMTGFGRTGEMFGFCHSKEIIPDIVTFAKGVNGAFVPLGGVGVRDHISEFFKTNAVGIGSTYNSHPVALASAYAALQHFIKTDILGNVRARSKTLEEGMNMLMENHPSIKQARLAGLFGMLDIQKNKKGDFIAKVSDPLPPAMVEFKQKLLDNGLWTMMRGHHVMCIPPLVINDDQIKEAMSIFDKCLHVLDDAMED